MKYLLACANSAKEGLKLEKDFKKYFPKDHE